MSPLLRPSTEVKVASALNRVVSLLVGLGIFAVSAYFEVLEMKAPPTHTTHIVIFACGMLLGILVAFRSFVFPVLQQFIVIAGPYIPGGRRASDPPGPPLPPPAP